MLVLSRTVNEEITIGNNIIIKVVKVVGNKIRLGISAPASVTIRRAEVAPTMQFIDMPLGQFESAAAAAY
jgi:carbon storage regulator